MRGSLRLALLSCCPLLLALPPPEEVNELRERLRERLREAESPEPVLLPHPQEPPLLRRPEEPAPIALHAPPGLPDEMGYYYHVNSRHRGKRRRLWPGEPTGAPGKSQRQRRRDARRTGRP